MPQKKETQNFETALERIEQLAAQMETGDLRLDDLIGAYEEGLRLLKYCSERLAQAEKRLQPITRDAAGRPQGLAPMPEPEEMLDIPAFLRRQAD